MTIDDQLSYLLHRLNEQREISGLLGRVRRLSDTDVKTVERLVAHYQLCARDCDHREPS